MYNSNNNINIKYYIFNIQMADRTCPNCKQIFNYPSKLKIHFQNVIHCKKTTEDIISFFVDSKTINTFICNTCKFTFIHNCFSILFLYHMCSSN